jgi:hypothetical protein
MPSPGQPTRRRDLKPDRVRALDGTLLRRVSKHQVPPKWGWLRLRRPKNDNDPESAFGISSIHLSDGALLVTGKTTAPARRLRALIEVLGFEGRGAQTQFAKEIGVDRRRLNNVLVGYPLSQKLAQKIIGRYPDVSSDFLLLGRSGGNLDRKLERRLLNHQRKTGISVFTS